MKQITITVPDNCELKQDGNTYTIVEKEKKLTYEDIAKKLFTADKKVFYITTHGIAENKVMEECFTKDSNNCISRKQAEKLLAINKLMNVAKYLNGNWQPNWLDYVEYKYYIYYDISSSRLLIDCNTTYQNNFIYFKSEKLAKQAIDILGEETIKLALCTDY